MDDRRRRIRGGRGGGESRGSRTPIARPVRRTERSKRPRPRRDRPSDQNIARLLEHRLHVSRSSIHNGWKQELGGLIRWYVNLPQHRNRPDEALARIERMYLSNRCDVQATKSSVLQSIADLQGIIPLIDGESHSAWIELRMIVENPVPINNSEQPASNTTVIENITYETIRQGRGVVLKTELRPGEGPAHAGSVWTVVKIPDWAINRPYYMEAVNRSTVDLSCEMSIDGHSAAKNAPIPAQERRTIQPAVQRYFETHEWRLTPAKSIPLHQASLLEEPATPAGRVKIEDQETQRGLRYNEKRPDYLGQRVSQNDFPDPSMYGWTFTGSQEPSKVEFFEKRLNDGSICKMDFFYTTATVKTTLYHPVQQRRTQLFRRCLGSDPDIYIRILKNPRYHSDLGYNRRHNQPSAIPVAGELGANDDIMMDAFDQDDAQNGTGVTYFAKNEDYAFDIEGHENRQAAMAKLQPTREFKLWEQATKQDWACIHAKLFVSMRRYMKADIAQRTSRPREERMHLPDMEPIVQVQAAQNAVVSTRFYSTGPSRESARKSSLRMERIKGLNDDPEWGTGPLFEVKLYYRAETALQNRSDDLELQEGDDDFLDEDEEPNTGEIVEVPLAEQLRDLMPLEVYKAEKIEQLHRWYQCCKVRDRDDGNARVTQTQSSISAASSTQGVDDCLKSYWDWHILQEMS